MALCAAVVTAGSVAAASPANHVLQPKTGKMERPKVHTERRSSTKL
jgi:hypothetical protein